MDKSLKRTNENNIVSIMNKTGWTREKTIEMVEDAKIRMGITYSEYDKYNLHNIPFEKQGIKFRKFLDANANKKIEREKNKGMYIAKTMAVTGWSYEEAEHEIEEARKHTGCMYKEYFLYRFYELDKKTQKEIFVANDASKILKKYNTNKTFVEIINDKGKTNKMFTKYLRRSWCVNTEVSLNEFLTRFKDNSKIIYKPINGLKGQSVEVFEIDKSNVKAVFQKLVTLPEGVVEEYVIQHEAMRALCPTSVNTIRIVTISSRKENSSEGKFVDIPYTTLRVGGGTSIVDNFHSGGMASAIDKNTGMLVTNAVNEEGEIYEQHPMTGVVFKGFKIPYYMEALEFVKNACEEFDIEGALGWDIAIAEDGPVLIEINQSPGAVLLSVPFVGEKIGMKHVMEKYL